MYHLKNIITQKSIPDRYTFDTVRTIVFISLFTSIMDNIRIELVVIMSNIVKKYRNKNELTQLELSKLCGVNQNYISRIERNVMMPSISFIMILSKIMNECPLVILKSFICNECSHRSVCIDMNNCVKSDIFI